MVIALVGMLASCVLISDEEIDSKTGSGTSSACQDGTAEAPLWFEDSDEDGLGNAESFLRTCETPAGYVADQTDCDDSDNSVGSPSVSYADVDGDSYGDDATAVEACELAGGRVAVGGDCNDGEANVHPGAEESDCDDPADYNCDGSTGLDDADGDGFAACLDCDDANGAVGSSSLWYADLDADTYGDGTVSVKACSAPGGYVADATECDDKDAGTFPGAPEYCDTFDDDCDGVADNDPADPATWYADTDADGYGDAASPATACQAPVDYVASDDDCNDTDATIHPGADETDCADATDYNCDGATGYVDGDGDGFAACEECDDADVGAFPGASETCDGKDNDCDSETDEADAVDPATWYADLDTDGYGDIATSTVQCDAPADYVANATDCDDSDAGVSPAAAEVCNGKDDDCDGVSDPSSATDAAIWYVDTDDDGYGDPGISMSSCDQPGSYVADATDCDDTDEAIHPGADETDCADATDYNCDGSVGYSDSDADGAPACDDCDDANAAAFPGATESCSTTFDDNCDGSTNDADAAGCTTYYLDTDRDSYGAASSTECVCAAASGYVTDSTDCDDEDSDTFPGAAPYDSTTACQNDGDGDDYGDATASTLYVAGTDLDDAKSTCTTLLTDTDGDGYYDCQDQCADVDGDEYGTTSATAATCVTNGGRGGTASCAGDAACTGTDVDDAKSSCTTTFIDTDGDGYYNCQDLCWDTDGDDYGTRNAAAGSCVTNGAAGGTTSCAGDAICTGADIDDAMSTCTTPALYTDSDGDGYYNCQDQCWDADGDGYGTSSRPAASCVTDGASGGTTSCAEDAACTDTDCDDADATVYDDADGDGVCDAGLVDYTTDYGSLMVAMSPGWFTMGADLGDPTGVYTDHSVALTHDFWIGETEITRSEWESWSGGSGWVYSTYYPCTTSTTTDDCPVHNISWVDVAQYANALSSEEGLSSCYLADGSDLVVAYAGDPYACPGYRMPTEAEWEYAARAGVDTTYSGSSTVEDVAWYYTNAYATGTFSHEVATLAPNAWGLYDMSGNHWEWTGDWYSTTYGGYGTGSASSDPPGPASGSSRVSRGGSWVNMDDSVTVAFRSYETATTRNADFGARLARSIP